MANGKKKRKGIWITLGVIAVVIIAAAIAFASRGSSKIDPSKLAKVEKGDLAKSVVATGKIRPIVQVSIKSKASGIVQKILKDTNDRVKEGDVLLELDKQEILASVRQSEARVNAAESALKAAMADEKRAEVDAQGVDIPPLKRAYERAQTMAKDGVVSVSALDDAEKAYDMAVNKRDVGVANLAVAQAKVAQTQAELKQAGANLEQLREQYRYATIVAPMNGVVLSRNVEIGDAVSSILVMGSSATEIGVIGDTHEVFVLGKVDESDVGKVYLGQPAKIKVESFKDKTFSGKVTKISPMGVEKDNVTTFEVRVSVDNPTGELKAAMTANAEIILDEHKGVLMVPESALIYDKDKKASVEVVDSRAKDGKRKVAITIGISNGAKTEVLSGLKEGTQVVLQ